MRGRSSDTQWGFEHLTPSEREAIQVDGVLMFRMIWLYLIAEAVAEERSMPKPFMGLQQPRDPESWAQPQDMGLDVPEHGFASCWALDAIKDLIQEHSFYLWHFDQGPLGHEKRKPTTIMSSIPAPPDVLVSGPGHGVPAKAAELKLGGSSPWPSSAWSAWAPGLKGILKREVVSVLDAWCSEKCCALLRDRENFLRHVVQGHVDFRRDCSACLAGAARGERHNRKSVHDAWVLHVDLLGILTEGADEHGKVRYALTGILTVPNFAKVSEAIRESEDIASGTVEPSETKSVDAQGQEPLKSVGLDLPMSSLGPPPHLPLEAIEEEDDLDEYEPSQEEEAEEPETAGEARDVERANKRWKEAAAALQLQECHTLEVPLLRMLPNKSQQSVAQGLAAMIANLRYEGFMIRRLHSDRGREFNNGLVHRLCRQRELYQTFTQGDDPKQNGRVEGYHAHLKGKTRTLLKAASADTRDWPCAMRTAQAVMWAKAMQQFGRPVWHPLPFGTNVKVCTRSWERYGDVWSDRVQDAVVLAPSVETCKGHVVRTAGGTLMHTTALFRGAVQLPPQPVTPSSDVLSASARFGPVPLSTTPDSEVPVSFPSEQVPPHRLRGKQSVPKSSVSRVNTKPELYALSQAAAALLACRPVPFRTAAALMVSSPDLWALARPLPARLSAGPSSMYLLFGWYKHGGLTGITQATSQVRDVVSLLNELLASAHPTGSWTTLALFSSAVADPHTDR